MLEECHKRAERTTKGTSEEICKNIRDKHKGKVLEEFPKNAKGNLKN